MMPVQSVWMLRLSLIWLLVSVMIGGLILLEKAMNIMPLIWGFLPVHYELAIWGWMVQFVIGTAYWMFPKYLSGSRRGPEWLAWSVLVVLNAGIMILTASILLQIPLLAQTGRGFILLSIFTFAALIWKRVVTYRNLKH